MPDKPHPHKTDDTEELSVKGRSSYQSSDQSSGQNSSPNFGLNEAKEFEHHKQQNSKVLWGIFSLLLVLVTIVIFVLPNYISEPSSDPTVIVVNPNSDPAVNQTQISPFEEAQTLRQRQSAQTALASLLSLQESLEEKEVESWAEEEFNQAINFARDGDDAYSQQLFSDAEEVYQQSADILQNIEDSLPDIFSQLMNTGDAGIISNNPESAIQAYRLAQVLRPDNSAALNGLNRAQSLNEVILLLNQGRVFHASNQLENAREKYQQGLLIDPQNIDGQNLLNQVDTDIIDQEFSNLMSSGYVAIQENAPDQAQTYFSQALELKPESAVALTAMTQAQDQITFSAINIQLELGEQFENSEQWQEALKAYESALAIDPNIVSAIDGKNRSESRNNLDLFLNNIITSPLRLADNNVYAQTVQVLADASTLSQSGSKLEKQIGQVQLLLNKVIQPVEVSFQSDGLTEVTLFRVSELGLFEQQTLALTPGEYTVVGVRNGYRDVREEFVIPLDGPIPLVSIFCTEEIL